MKEHRIAYKFDFLTIFGDINDLYMKKNENFLIIKFRYRKKKK